MPFLTLCYTQYVPLLTLSYTQYVPLLTLCYTQYVPSLTLTYTQYLPSLTHNMYPHLHPICTLSYLPHSRQEDLDALGQGPAREAVQYYSAKDQRQGAKGYDSRGSDKGQDKGQDRGKPRPPPQLNSIVNPNGCSYLCIPLCTLYEHPPTTTLTTLTDFSPIQRHSYNIDPYKKLPPVYPSSTFPCVHLYINNNP